MKKVSAIIPSFEGKKLLKKNLPSVLMALNVGDEIIIIDDASSKNSGLIWLEDVFKKEARNKKIKLTLIKNKKNLRFGASVNKGVEVAEHDLVFLLNNDVSPHKDCLKYLLPYFSPSPQVNAQERGQGGEVFAVACLEWEQKNGQKIKHGKNELWFERGIFIHSRAKDYKSGETAWATGGSALFDRKKFLELGGFDKKFYPAYWEDIDLSFRAKKKGWKVLFEEQAEVDHNHESTNREVFGQKTIENMSFKNADKFTLKNANFWQKIAYFLWKPYWIYKRSRI